MGKRPKAAPKKRAPKRHRVSRGEGARLVRGVRRRLKLTQGGLAARLGVAQMTVSRWESGEAPVRGPIRLALGALAAFMKAEAKRKRKVKAVVGSVRGSRGT